MEWMKTLSFLFRHANLLLFRLILENPEQKEPFTMWHQRSYVRDILSVVYRSVLIFTSFLTLLPHQSYLLLKAAPSYTTKCDIWSIGVVAYVLLCGYPPFNAGNERLTYDLVQDGELKFPSPAWDHISPEAMHFIRRLMTRDPDQRPTATEALQHPWLNQDNVQPRGMDKRVSFMPRNHNCSNDELAESKQVKYTDIEKQSAFQRFLKRFKVLVFDYRTGVGWFVSPDFF